MTLNFIVVSSSTLSFILDAHFWFLRGIFYLLFLDTLAGNNTNTHACISPTYNAAEKKTRSKQHLEIKGHCLIRYVNLNKRLLKFES